MFTLTLFNSNYYAKGKKISYGILYGILKHTNINVHIALIFAKIAGHY